MHIVTIEGIPYAWLEQLQKIHAHVFDGANLPLEKLEKKEGLLCILAVEGGTLIGFKLGYPHPDGVFYSWLGGVHVTKRGQGIASQLMKQQHEHIKSLGFHKVRTYGRNTRKAMLITNLKHGFDIVSTFSDEKGRHKIIFEKTID
ncbi:GNAT family N-acetyltransferase [Lysinibacillus fusiformis]|uniref:GNAT family N-acetyltransferase n=1 Tax=Lysinibacillus fusiformis TaxID=28031 RepID=UPI0019681D31|nr:GNAT family N-acetyltransferase [Lysinibacillus fusiformis]QSB09797.1 GNAT family N-acetyltransferase [Lysinibacillus fusiformis]